MRSIFHNFRFYVTVKEGEIYMYFSPEVKKDRKKQMARTDYVTYTNVLSELSGVCYMTEVATLVFVD